MPQSFADVNARPGYVRIRGQEARTSLNRVSILARKLTSVYARVTTKMEFEPEVYQHSAGLILYYDNMNYVNLRKYYSETLGSPALSVVQLENGTKTEYNDWRVPAPGGAVWMRLYVEGRKIWLGKTTGRLARSLILQNSQMNTVSMENLPELWWA